LPPINQTTMLAGLAGLLLLGWLSGALRVRTEDGVARLTGSLLRNRSLEFDFRDTWLLLALVVVLGWSIASALQNSSWVPGSERLPAAVVVAITVGWLLAVSRLSRRAFLLVGLAVVAAYTMLSTLDAVHLGPNFDVGPVPRPLLPIALWGSATWFQSRFALLIGLVALAMLAGLWTSWWVFRRRAGLVALLPTGTILAVEVLNDTTPVMYFFSFAWLAAAVLLLLRLNYVRLKERWHARRIPRAQDTTWTFGEIGFEATALLLLVVLLLPALTTDDFSSQLVPSTLNASGFHPFNFGTVFRSGPLDVGYSETVRPGAKLRAKPIVIMSVTGQFTHQYPYWRGVALGGWDGEGWYLLDASPELAVGQRGPVAPKLEVPRADMPSSQQLQYVVNTFHVQAATQTAPPTAFSAGELIWVDGHPITVRGIINRPGGSAGGQLNTSVNVVGPQVSFETVDQVHLTDRPRTPYTYVVYSAAPEVDEQTLRGVATDYPPWIEPYRSLYYRGNISNAGDTGRDADIAGLALTIVQKAHATNPYAEAKAIEAWLRDRPFSYTLEPRPAPAGTRQLDYFLFTSHSGYCQDFASAMAVLLRSLPDPVPVRVVNGYGIGSFEAKSQRYVVRATDAHTWVEVFFPGYGWQPFEPTPDNANFPILRPATPADLKAGPASGGEQSGQTGAPAGSGPSIGIGGLGSGSSNSFVDVSTRVGIGLVAALLLALLLTVASVRWYLRPEDAPRIWRRLRFLGRELQVPIRPGDTPHEYGVKLAAAVPMFAQEISTLARLFTRARYRRAGLDRRDLAEMHAAWDRVRRRYPRLLLSGLRQRVRNGNPGQPRPAGGRWSGSREPAGRREPVGRSRGASG